jgi:hypothetical protein
MLGAAAVGERDAPTARGKRDRRDDLGPEAQTVAETERVGEGAEVLEDLHMPGIVGIVVRMP